MNSIKTKIVATLGPSSESTEILEKLVLSGLDIARFNFSHGNIAEHQNKLNNLKFVSDKLRKKVFVLQDLAGPKIRIGDFDSDSINLAEGTKFILTTKEITGNKDIVHINYKNIKADVALGHTIFLHDGKKKLRIIDINNDDIVCEVLVGGNIKGRRGVNLPDSNLSISSITPKDISDLEFGIQNKVDFIALSFVRKVADVEELRKILNESKTTGKDWQPKIIAKIETPQAIEDIDNIIQSADGIMVARGDLGIEVPREKVPLYQKEIIEKCNKLGKFVITATQMMESMINSNTPTRAEVSDVVNAILDGTDAIMLSEETALGRYPIETLETMRRIASEVEENYPSKWWTRK